MVGILPFHATFCIHPSLFICKIPAKALYLNITSSVSISMSKNDLENRLVRFAVSVMQLTEQLPNTKIGNQLSSQIIRSSSSIPLNYGEAQSAESRKDFIHKVKVVLKELRETNANLKMIDGLKLLPVPDPLVYLLKEADELISIFVTSVNTAIKNDALAKKIQISGKLKQN
jgi:four helix bundle protein